MGRFIWSDIYSVGIPAMDEQHQRLFAMLNDLHLHGVEASQTELARTVLDQLFDYIAEHFAAEEALMAEMAYPALEEHKTTHRQFVRQVLKMRKQERQGNLNFDVLQEFLMDWLVLHIKGRDRDGYGAALVSERADTAPSLLERR
ncbi:MAG: hemerythrin family protein [Deltaproteobacteria bacterium]|nr:hemerythrin family protein [Deltaproteobacteria bacterium]